MGTWICHQRVMILFGIIGLASGAPSGFWNREASFSENIDAILRRYRRQAKPDYDIYGHPCTNYINLVQPERRVGNKINHLTDSALCDRTLKRRWYRFAGPAGGVMPESCVDEFNCGTHAPIWLNGQHPLFYGEVLDLPVCVSLSGDCCEKTWYIRIANCGEFYTYLLPDTPGCFMAYCAGRQDPCPEGQSSITGFSPGCSDNFPALSGDVEIHVDQEGHQVAFYCDYTGPIPISSIIETEWFVDGDNSGPGDAGKFPIFVDKMRGRRRSKLEEGRWMGKMGSNVYCRMRARWANRTGVPSRYLSSKKYFAGIKIAKRVVEVSESEAETHISLQSTLPVTCLPQFMDACKITVEFSHDPELGGKKCIDGNMEQVVFGDCSLDITTDNWRQNHNVTVKAVRDFYKDGNKNMRVNFKPIYSTTMSPLWDSYQLPDVEVIAKDVDKALCTSTGDPHYNTFDGLYYHVYLEGEFVLYKNTRLPIQINTRLEECGKVVTCNCAVAVKAADDVIVIDRCKRHKRNLAYGRSFPEGWRTLHRHALEQGESFVDGLKIYEYDGGRRYTVHLPTGAYIDFKVGDRWVDIFLHGSSDDWRSTLGLCGTFDNDRENDMTLSDGYTQVAARAHEACGESENVCKFAESWRVSQKDSFFGPIIEVPVEEHSFFNKKKYCKCEKINGKSTVTCNYHYDVINCQGEQMKQYGVDKTDDIKIRSSSGSMSSHRYKRSLEEDWSDDVIDYFQEAFVYNASFRGQIPKWPTPTGITESYARRYCDETITRSYASRVCNHIVQDKVDILIDECMTDIKVSGELSWAVAALTAMTEECRNKIHEDPQYWETPEETEVNQYSYNNSHGAALLTNVCPSDCSLRGSCSQGKCRCIHGYEGDDCSTEMFVAPEIFYISEEGLCDHHTRPCLKVKAHGTGFRKTADLRCYFQVNDDIVSTSAIFVTFEEIFCKLPVTMEAKERIALKKLAMFVTQDGYRSNSKQIGVYDSRCYSCDVTDDGIDCTRIQDEASCLIEDVCYGAGERNPNNCCQTCNPTMSDTIFTNITDFQSISLYPRQTSYTITQGSPWQLTIRAFGGSRCEFVYTPTANRNTPFAHVTTKGSLQITVADDVTGRFEEEVMVKDPCGGEVSRVYDVTIKERPPTEGRFITDKQINCDGNAAPVFDNEPYSYLVLANNSLTIQINATDPDGDDVEYYVIKQSNSYVTISKGGLLRYHAGARTLIDKITLQIEDPCTNKAHQVVLIKTIQCACANGSTCLMEKTSPSSTRPYRCLCNADRTGELCDTIIE